MRRPLAAVVGLGAVLALSNPASAQQVRRTVHGDTTIVETIGNGPWGPPKQAALRLQLGANLNTSPFDQLACIAALPHGAVAVYDVGLPQVFVIDSTGRIVRRLGRKGSGPGEYGGGSYGKHCMTTTADGTILLLDIHNARIDRWDSAGHVLRAIAAPTTQGMFVGPDRSVYLAFRLHGSDRRCEPDPTNLMYQHLDAEGDALDTIPVQHSWLGPISLDLFHPDEYSMPLRDGRVLVTGSDRLAFLIKSMNSSSMTLAEHPVPPVKPTEAERREQLAGYRFNDSLARGGCPVQAIAAVKSAFWSVQQDLNNRIWLLRHVPVAEVVPHPWYYLQSAPIVTHDEPIDWAAFSLDGHFLGEVVFPSNVEPTYMAFSGHTAWAIAFNADRFSYLERFTIPGIPSR